MMELALVIISTLFPASVILILPSGPMIGVISEVVDIPPGFSAVSIALNSDVDIVRINGLDVEQCFPMQKNITMKFTNKQIFPGAWYIGLFNGIGATRTQSKMINRGREYSFSANVSVDACINSMMTGEFCNNTVYPLSCTTYEVYKSNALKDTVMRPLMENAITCKSNLDTFCVEEGVINTYSLDITNVAEELTINAVNIRFNNTTSNNASSANDFKLMCFARHGAMPSESLHDYSSDLTKGPLIIRSPLIGRLYIIVSPFNLTKEFGGTRGSDVKVCYSLESQVLQCPLGKAGPNCTMGSYTLQTVLTRGSRPFESYYLPIGEGASSANFPLEPLLNNSSNGVQTDDIWTYFTLDLPRGAAGRNIHIRLSSDVKISYEVYARFGGLPSLDSWDYYYANKTRKSDQSMFFMLYHSSDDNVDFYIIYAREGTWGFGLRHLNTSGYSSKGQTAMSLSLEGCPKGCSSHGDCRYSFDASGLTSYSFCSCDRNHGGYDCSIEIVSHKGYAPSHYLVFRSLIELWKVCAGHIVQSIFLIASNAAAILPAYWALRQKAFAEWILFTSSGTASAIYHACDVGTWCVLSYNVLQFMDFWLSFMAVISTLVYLTTISEVHKRAIHTAVFILTALLAATKATRSSNIVLVIVFGVVGLLIGWLIEMSSKYSSLSIGFSLNFLQSSQTIKQRLRELVKKTLRRFRWGFALAGFVTLVMAASSWVLENSQTYWFWHSFWHATIYTSSFFFLCSKVDTVRPENPPPSTDNYALTRQDSFPRNG
ncbi:unnamed protein product [Lupinus luteus]|uniref:EGF-like domain-containing protein n=1 Tax=Lupinus luteus TaxID=3873 RepID=A0AAV1X075_LUPLU